MAFCKLTPGGFGWVSNSSVAPCPAGTWSGNGSTLTGCRACATADGFAPLPNQTGCRQCDVGQIARAATCGTCLPGFYCAAGSSDAKVFACPFPEACLGTTCNEILGYKADAPYCATCAPRFFRSNLGCSPCSDTFWLYLPGAASLALIVGFGAWAFGSAMKPTLDAVGRAVQKNRIAIILLGDQVTRLTLINRVATLRLPPEFKRACAYVGLILGLNTATAGVECSNIPWSFSQSYAVIMSIVALISGAALALDIATRREGIVRVDIAQWRVWDALDLLLPFAVQAAWQACTYIKVGDRNVLMIELNTQWDSYEFIPIVGFSIFIIIFDAGFLFIRYGAPCVACRVTLRTEATGALAFAPARRGITATPSRRFELQPGGATRVVALTTHDSLFAFNFFRALIGFFRMVSIYLQSYNIPVLPAAYLLALNGAELLVLGCTNARAEITTAQGVRLSVALFTVFALTHAAGVACAVGTCGGVTDTALAGVLLGANFVLFVAVARGPARDICRSYNAAPMALEGDDGATPRAPGAADAMPVFTTESGQFITYVMGKAVISNVDPRLAAGARGSSDDVAPPALATTLNPLAGGGMMSLSRMRGGVGSAHFHAHNVLPKLPGSTADAAAPAEPASPASAAVFASGIGALAAVPAAGDAAAPVFASGIGALAPGPAAGDAAAPAPQAAAFDETTAPDGQPLRAGWRRERDDNTGDFYYTHNDEASLWDPPLAAAAPPAAAAGPTVAASATAAPLFAAGVKSLALAASAAAAEMAADGAPAAAQAAVLAPVTAPAPAPAPPAFDESTAPDGQPLQAGWRREQMDGGGDWYYTHAEEAPLWDPPLAAPPSAPAASPMRPSLRF